MKKTALVLSLFLSVFLYGCPNHTAMRYSSSTDNVIELRKFDQKVSVGDFQPNYLAKSDNDRGSEEDVSEQFEDDEDDEPERTSDKKTSIMCRAAGPVNAPQGKPFSDYIRDAFIDELRLAKLYDEKSPVELTAKVNKVDFSSVSGVWELDITVNSSNGRSLHVAKNYDYHTAFGAVSACQNTAQALQPAVQDLIKKLVTHEEFPSLLKPN